MTADCEHDWAQIVSGGQVLGRQCTILYCNALDVKWRPTPHPASGDGPATPADPQSPSS